MVLNPYIAIQKPPYSKILCQTYWINQIQGPYEPFDQAATPLPGEMGF
jgi:hypothetical protein